MKSLRESLGRNLFWSPTVIACLSREWPDVDIEEYVDYAVLMGEKVATPEKNGKGKSVHSKSHGSGSITNLDEQNILSDTEGESSSQQSARSM